MNKVRCEGCAKELPMSDSLRLGEKILCHPCLEKVLREQRDPHNFFHAQTDPTICTRCGRDNMSAPWPLVGGAPFCEPCIALLRNRPFPSWIKVFFAIVAFLVVGSLVWNWRFIRAYADMRGVLKAMEQKDIEKAAELMHAVAVYVPEKREFQALDDFYRGLVLLKQDKCKEALAVLERSQSRLPAGANVDTMILWARAGACFDSKDYDGFLEAANEYLKQRPGDFIAIGQVSSAYACKYAATGDESFKQESLKFLDQARAAAKGDPAFREYEERILHRLHTREIIKGEEFKRRFPQGWKGPAGEGR